MIRKSFRTNALCMVMCLLFAGGVSSSAQTTEGKDFWVTFLRADSHDSDDKKITLSLSISSREACEVVLENPHSGYYETVQLNAGELKEVQLYNGTANVNNNPRQSDKKICYTYLPDQVDSSAIHVTATAHISLFASNHKDKSFDATNVLPTAALLSDYIVQTYTPSVHSDTPQGSHFAIIATEDNTVVDYSPTVEIEGEFGQFQNALNVWGPEQVFEVYPEYERFRNYLTTGMISTPTLQKGQVWYVWTGDKQGETADLSGTVVKARDGKKIAVFQGCPHTNIPDKIRDRDHIFSQAMPTSYWGNTFALTASMTRKRDIVRVLALNDGTEVRVNGQLVYTFDFSTNPKRTFEFEIGEQDVYCSDSDQKKNNNKNDVKLPLSSRTDIPVFIGTDCFVETSCPCAVHLFMCSNTYDSTPDGDPAMVWINPIEQVIDQITFATYMASNTHYVNIVTTKQNVASMILDGSDISGDFSPVTGSNDMYYFARKNITHDTHTLKGDSGFIAHVYGYGDKESYAYSAGGSAKVLSQTITINGEEFSSDTENTLCGEDVIEFACQLNYDYEKIEWYFGDGESDLTNKDFVPHFYENTGVYHAYVLIYRKSSNVCVGQSAVDSIPITVTIGRYEFSINDISIPCPEDGKEYIGKVFYSNAGKVNLHGDNVTIEFDDAAIVAGFKNDELVITDDYFQITIPETAEPDTYYGIHMVINSDCGGADTTMNFMLNYDKDVITQRYNNVLGLQADYFKDKTLSDIQWYRTSDSTAVAGQVSANLNFRDLPEGEFEDDTYYVCFTINKGTSEEVITCACAKAFIKNDKGHNFGEEDIQTIVAYSVSGDKIFVNADWGGETDIECYAQWITTSGSIYQNLRFDIPDGGCTIPTPTDNGLYLLRVVTDKQTRSFKFSINH